MITDNVLESLSRIYPSGFSITFSVIPNVKPTITEAVPKDIEDAIPEMNKQDEKTYDEPKEPEPEEPKKEIKKETKETNHNSLDFRWQKQKNELIVSRRGNRFVIDEQKLNALIGLSEQELNEKLKELEPNVNKRVAGRAFIHAINDGTIKLDEKQEQAIVKAEKIKIITPTKPPQGGYRT